MLPLRNWFYDRHHASKRFRITSSVVLILLAHSFSAAQQPPPREGGGRGGPPPEAFTACETLTQGDVCTVETPRGSLTGTCRPDRRSDALICVPANRADGERPPRDGQEPSEADQSEGSQHRSMREQNPIQSSGVSQIYPANLSPITDNKIEMQVESEWRIIKANSISVYKTGMFPNPGHPNSITKQAIKRIKYDPV